MGALRLVSLNFHFLVYHGHETIEFDAIPESRNKRI
jgi:hypothetical protein